MRTDLAAKLIDDYQRGRMSRRELAHRLLGLGAAMAAASAARGAEPAGDPAGDALLHARGIDHVALDVTDIARSREFYKKHLGLRVLRDGGERQCFMGPPGGEFILALFRSDTPGMNHYCYGIADYDPDRVAQALREAGVEPRREGGRVYFPDPDGLTVQVTGWSDR
ncbi:VOC family protein [Botrimarina sp.]|uniref:VOC family protein n=1 Tax=Botrimarina sp. TaxID=2795802 RepID=UPI0032ED1846